MQNQTCFNIDTHEGATAIPFSKIIQTKAEGLAL